MDLVEAGDEDLEDVQEDFTEMVDILMESTSLKVVDVVKGSKEGSQLFHCTIELTNPLD
jgi:major membrane immunogen (membrane-anchored lipoprotein)